MKRCLSYPAIILGIAVIALTACKTPETPPAPAAQLKPVTLDNTIKIAAGQTLYVPVYSHIYTWDQSRTINLTATLSIRNTDLNHPIVIAAVNYYSTNGALVRKYLEHPVELGSLASTSFIVDQDDGSGGSGAAFLVEWVAQVDVSAPIVEAIMINTAGNQGLSFVSSGRVIKSRGDSK
jgi:hypothetical protein